MPENDQNYVCLLVKEADWIVSLYKIFWRFLNSPPDFYERNGDSIYIVCMLQRQWYRQVDWKLKFIQEGVHTTWNNPLSTKCWKYGRIYFVKTGDNIHVESFRLTRCFIWETFNSQANIAVSVCSVKKSWYWPDGVVPRPGQHFNPVCCL